MSDEAIFRQILRCREEGIPAALATVVEARGHTPREVGAKMLILRDGRCFGTIGGGCGESEVRLRALSVMDEGIPSVHRVNLVPVPGDDESAVCGGIMLLFIEPVAPKQEG